jgi:hypothetical protein
LFAGFARQCPRTGDDWLKQFQYFFEHMARHYVILTTRSGL